MRPNRFPRWILILIDSQKREGNCLCASGRGEDPLSWGFTLIELLLVLAMIATLAGIATPSYVVYINKAKVVQAIAEITQINRAIFMYRIDHGELPSSLADVGYGDRLDPWGHLYQYFNLETAQGNGQARQEQFIVPLNSGYDLYSMGRDGKSEPLLTAKVSRDDIISANDGGYIGLAALY